MQNFLCVIYKAEEVTFSINPNTLGCVCILAMSGLLQLFMARKSKVTDFIFIAIMAISGILTVSRTFIILFIIMIFLFLIANKGSMRKKVKFSMVLIAGCFIVFVLLNTIFPDALMNLQERFLVDDISSGRDDLFGKYNDFILSSRKILLFGVGAIELPQKVTEQYDVARNVPHNGIQELIIAWGIIGFILFLWFFILLVRDVQKKNNYISLINYIPLILIFAKIQVGQFLTSDYTMLALAFVYLSLCQDFRQRKS